MNVASIRTKISQAIDKMPTEVALNRHIIRSDGMGGKTKDKYPTEVAVFNGLLDNSEHSFLVGNTMVTDAGTVVIERSTKLYVVWSENYDILKDDFFIIGSLKFTIKNAVNILNMNIYYECDLESQAYES